MFYATAKTSFKHIITMNIEINKSDLIIKKNICFKCFKNKKKIDFKKNFKKIKCIKIKYDGETYTASCNSHLIGTGAIYYKSVKGNIEKASITGMSQYELDPDFAIGLTSFTFLNKQEQKLYIEYLEDNFFITSETFKKILYKNTSNN